MLPEVVLGAATMSVTLGGIAAARARRSRRAADGLRSVLEAPRIEPGPRLAVGGRLRGIDVEVRHADLVPASPGRGRGPHTLVRARLSEGLRPLSVGPPRSPFGHVLALEPLVPSGDEGFDRRTAVTGPDLLVGASLTEAARALLAGLVHARRGRVDGGWVEVALPSHLFRVDCLEDNLDLVARIAQALDHHPADVPARLERIALRDGVQTVRELALSRLLEHYPDAGATARALDAALSSEAPRLRLLAAGASTTTRGADVARALLSRGDLVHEDRVRALGLLARLEGDASAVDELRGLLRTGPARVQVAAAEALGEVGDMGVAGELHELAQRLFTPGDVRRAASRALLRVRARCGTDCAGALSLCSVGMGRGALSLSDASDA